MNESLPKVTDLEKLSVRAIAAYASRTADRLSVELRGLIADDVLDNVLDRTRAVWQAHFLGDVDVVSLLLAGEVFLKAKRDWGTTKEKRLIGGSIRASARVAYCLYKCADDPLHGDRQLRYMRRAARAAEAIALNIDALDIGSNAVISAAISAGRRDYELLLSSYGEHDEFRIGDLVDCFDRDNDK